MPVYGDYPDLSLRERREQQVSRAVARDLRVSLGKAMRRQGVKQFWRRCLQQLSITELIGCTPDQLRSHLEAQFQPEMRWATYGQWGIGHIKPCSRFDLADPKQLAECAHFSNLQPLWR